MSAANDEGDARTHTLSFGTRIDLRAAVEHDPPPLDFVLHGLIAGESAGLIAPGSTGKSFLMLAIGAEVATGGAYCDVGLVAAGGAKPGRVLYLPAEDSAPVIVDRAHALGSHLMPEVREQFYENFDVWATRGTTPALVSHTLAPNDAVIAELIDYLRGYRLVMFDPLRRWHHGDENKSADMTILADVFDRIAIGSVCALLFSHHANKNATQNGTGGDASASRGSSAICDSIRLQMNLHKLDAKELAEHELGKNDASWYVALDFSKINHVAPEGARILHRRDDGTLCRDETAENAREIGRKKSRAKIGSIAPACAAAGDDLPTLAEYIDGLH